MGFGDSKKDVNAYLASLDGSFVMFMTPGDARSPSVGPVVHSVPHHFNGATFDRVRGAHAVSILASAARTASVVGTTQTLMPGLRGARWQVYCTAFAATPSVTADVQVSDTLSTWNTILSSAAIVGTGPTELVVYPGCVAVANKVLNEPLARSFRIAMTHADADSITYTVSCDLLP